MNRVFGLKTEFLLQIAITLLLVLATATFGIGDSSATLILLTLAMAAGSTLVFDIRGYFRLSQPMANCAALAIVAISCINALRLNHHGDRHGLLIAVGELQSYLQYVLLFQRK